MNAGLLDDDGITAGEQQHPGDDVASSPTTYSVRPHRRSSG